MSERVPPDPGAEAEPPPDPGVLQQRAADPAASVWVAASAGTGKTKVLTDRVLRLMLAGTAPHRILCLTFTKAAAAEMANRIFRTLSLWATVPEPELESALAALTGERPPRALPGAARRLFARVLDAPGGMRIETIHAFCQSLLRRFPVEAGLAPYFQPMEERDAAELLAEVRERLLADPDPAAEAAIATVAEHTGEQGFGERIAELVAERGRLRRLLHAHGGADGLAAAVRDRLGVRPGEDEAAVIAAFCDEASFDGPGLRRAAEALLAGSDKDRERGRALADWLGDPAGRAVCLGRVGTLLLTDAGRPRATLITKAASRACPDAPERLSVEAERHAALGDRLGALGVAEATAALVRLGATLIERYDAAKARRAALDYDDLVLRTLALLGRPGIAPWVLFKLDGGIDHILIDEAQDTNPDQWQVVAALAEEFFAGRGARDSGRTIFAVGDEKQSIFSFQRADPREFERTRRHFAERVAAAGQPWWPVDLTVSFRSARAVLDAVDAVFARPAAREGLTADPETPIRHRAHRRGAAGLVELWPAMGPADAVAEEPWTPPVDQGRVDDPASRLAERISATIRGWLDRGERLPARDRPIVPGDVLILVRRRNRFFMELVRALKARDVPVAGVDRMVLTEQLAVMDLMALGDILLLPEDDLTLAAVLKGPLIGLDEEQLLALAHGRPGRLWDALRGRSGPAFADAHAYLAGLMARVDRLRPYELLAAVLAEPCPADPVSGRRALLARLGAEAEDPIDELLAAVLSHEAGEAPSLQRCLHWLRAGEGEVKRELDQDGRQRVRLMTVHGAKGLQAPVVFLPDTVSVPGQSPAILWPDEALPVPLWPPRREMEEACCREARDRANRRRDREYRRLLYVALTRAEDRLYIAGYHGAKGPSERCWHALCRAGLERLDGIRALPDGTLRHELAQDGAARAETTAGAGDGAPPLPSWARRAPAPEPTPPRPLVPSRPTGAEPAVRSPLAEDGGLRFRRGRLVHVLLQRLPDLAPADREPAVRRFLARPTHGLSRAEQDALCREVLGVLTDPTTAPLFGPGSRAEVPVVGILGEGASPRVLSGQIDRLIVTDERVLLLDYKTSRPPPARPEDVPPVYLRQLAAYRAALRPIYGASRSIEAGLLWTDGPRWMPISHALLDRHAP